MENHSIRNARLRRLNAALCNVAGDNIALYTHLVWYPVVKPQEPRKFSSRFAADLDATYQARVLEGCLFQNSYALSLIVSPQSALRPEAARRLARWGEAA